jgi:hypothetical protein
MADKPGTAGRPKFLVSGTSRSANEHRLYWANSTSSERLPKPVRRNSQRLYSE